MKWSSFNLHKRKKTINGRAVGKKSLGYTTRTALNEYERSELFKELRRDTNLRTTN